MNIILKLTEKHLLENKKRTVVTILGIAASTALITAILVGVFSFFKFFGTVNRMTDGDVHADFSGVSWNDVETLKNDERIRIAGAILMDPTITGIRVSSDKEDRFRTGNVMHADADLFSQLVVGDHEGRLPETSDEVAVEEAFLEDNGLDLEIGDKITFEQGNRYEIEPDGNRIYYAGSYRSEERFETLSTDTCTITAILHENRPTKGYDILRGMEAGTKVGMDDKGIPYLHCRVTLKKPDYTSVLQLRQIEKDHNLHIDDINSEFMISVFAIKGMGEAYIQFFTMTGIALIIVVITSVVLIYNAFGMSLAEKIRYLGMLASVGATKAQKRASIYYEGLVLGIIGIPLGILAGTLGAMVTLNVLGSRLLETEVIVGAEGMRGGIPIVVSPLVILAIVILSAITIFISALIPAIKASNVMPVDAMRQTNIVRVRAGKLKTNPFIKRLFGYEGVLACKNIKRNGVKGTVIVISLAISVIMFLTIDFFNKTFVKINEYEIDLPFDMYVSCAPDEKDRLKGELESLPEVDRVVAGDYVRYLIRPQDDDPGFVPVNENILESECLTDGYKSLPDKTDGIMVITVEDVDFDALLEENGIDRSGYYGNELKGVILDSFLHTENSKSVFTDAVIGRRAFYDDPAGNPPAVEIGGIVSYKEDNYVCNLVPKKTVDVYVPASMYFKKAAENIDNSTLSYTFGVFHKGDPKVLEEKIGDLTANGGYHNSVVHNLSDSIAVMDTVSLMLNTAMYGFTILLTLIAMANIVNTISTAVLLRRQEFAMFRSVGMEEKGIRRMLLLETFLYGFRALLIGIPLSLLLSYLMFNTSASRVFTFEPDYPMYIIMIFAVFSVVGLCMLLSSNKIKNDNIIEALKEDAV